MLKWIICEGKIKHGKCSKSDVKDFFPVFFVVVVNLDFDHSPTSSFHLMVFLWCSQILSKNLTSICESALTT